MQESVRVCVTGIGGGGFGEQILKALHYASTPYFILGTDVVHESTGSACVDKFCIVPPAKQPQYCDSIVELCVQHHIQALFVGSEAELLALSSQRHKFEDAGILFPYAPHEVIQLCLDKCALFEALAHHNVRAPRFVRVRTLSQIPHNMYPLVLKPSTGGGGSSNVFIVQNREEAESFGAHLLHLYTEIIAQEYIGTPEEEYTVGVLADMNGEILQSMALHRTLRPALSRRLSVPNRTGRQSLGAYLVISSGISQGRTGVYTEITQQCEAIAHILGARGPFNIQCRVVDGIVWLFEINPRFSGTTSMRAMVGMNEPDMLVRKHVLGENILRGLPVKDCTILRRLEEVMV